MKAEGTRIDTSILKVLSRRNGYYWIKDALMDWAIMISAFATVGYTQSIFLVLPAMLIIGNRQHGLSLLGHDGTHYTISYNKKLNDFLTNLLTWWPLGLTLSGYRNLHSLHHKNLGTEGDPEIHHKKSRAPQWDLPNKLSNIVKYACLDLAGYSFPDYYIIVTYSKPTSKSSYTPLIAIHVAFITISLASGHWWIPAMWYSSLPTTFMMFFRLRLWLEHQGSDTAHRLHLTRLQGALFAPHLSWHHWEHHKWPSIPYHNLPKLRTMVTSEPIITLSQLIDFYQTSKIIPSGTSLKKTKTMDMPTSKNFSPTSIDEKAA